MPLGPPWRPEPHYWSLDGRPIRIVTPSTRNLALALITPEDSSGLHVVMEYTPTADQHYLYDRIGARHSGVTLELLHDVADRLVESTLGVPRWTATRVWQHALGSWTELDGELMASGVDVMELEPSRAYNVVFGVLRRWFRNDADGWKRLRRELDREPRREVLRQIRRRQEQAAARESESELLPVTVDEFAQFRQLMDQARGKPTPVDSGGAVPVPDTLTE